MPTGYAHCAQKDKPGTGSDVVSRKENPPDVGQVDQLAQWANEFAKSPVPPGSADRIADVLIDSVACAFYAAGDDKGAGLIDVVREAGIGGACTVIGTGLRTSLPQAAFANGALIRLLDFNDTYNGRTIGHPSDILGAAFAAAELAQRSGEDLQRGVRLGYEVYGRLLDLFDPETVWDHVTVCGISTAVMCGWLLRLSPQQLAQAIALSAMHSAVLGEVRVGKVSSAKSIASATLVQTATLLTQLAGKDLTGPPQALEGRRGFSQLLLNGAGFADFFATAPQDRLALVGLKPYPCFALGQGPIALAARLRETVPIKDIERIDVFIANTGPARLRLSDTHGRAPELNEAADHSIYVLLALALIDGYVGGDQFKSGRWRDPEVMALVERIFPQIDPALSPAKDLPCRIVITANGGSHSAEYKASPGNPANPLSRAEIIAKFKRCTAGRLSDSDQKAAIDALEGLHRLSSLAPLYRILGNAPHSH